LRTTFRDISRPNPELRLLVREFSVNDAENLFELTSDSDVVRYLEFGPTSRAEAQGLMDFAVGSSLSVPRTGYGLVIVKYDTGSLIGSCGLQVSDDDSHTAELYVVFRRDRWGQGLVSELVPALISLAYGAAGFDCVYGVVHPDNNASIRMLERVRMVSDGTIPDVFENDGRWRVGQRYAILGS